MDKDGVFFVLVPLVLAVIAAAYGLWIPAGILVIIGAFMLFFFRDPKRDVPAEEGVVVSSADGRVTRVEERDEGMFVSVFLSPFDVHINRAPISGKVTEVKKFTGKKRPATSDTASATNERNALTIEGPDMTVVCTQIVGILARRIVCRTEVGKSIERGERFGLIRFGSRTDLLMPANVTIMVKPGDRVRGGETVIARLEPKS